MRGTRKQLALAAAGVIVVGASAIGVWADKDEGGEQKVAFKDAPAAVQKTLTREAGGSTVDSVEKEQKHGQTVYEADATIDGKPYEIKVAEDGTLLSKKLDKDDDDKGADKKD